MASISTAKLKEMEAEMNRFEQEILAPGMAPRFPGGPPPRMIIGSHTFSKVQARLTGDPRDMGPSIHPSVLSGSRPPPPPPLMSNDHDTSKRNMFLPPPPPPPLSNVPAFVPPQLRNRAPGPPMHRPPLPNRPPGPPQSFGQPQMMQRPPMGGPPPMRGPAFAFQGRPPLRPPVNLPSPTPIASVSAPPSIDKPKVVYSSGPVRNFPKPESEKKSEAVSTTSERVPKAMETADGASADVSVSESGEVDSEAGLTKKERKERKRKFVRTAAGTVWEDPTLAEWENDDFRMFCGDLGNEVTDEHLARAFAKYPTFLKAKVVRDRRSNKTKGYGFVSFSDPTDFSRAMREMNGKYVGNRPIKLRKSAWRDRQIDVVRRKDKEKKRLGLK